MPIARSVIPLVLSFASIASVAPISLAEPLPPAPVTPRPELVYDAPFFPGAVYDQEVPTPDSLLGFALGSRGATHAKIEQCLKTWAEKFPTRCKLVEYARTHENRACYYFVISSEENIANLPSLKTSLAKLADPRTTSASEADSLITKVPGVAWLAYNIHGDENSPSDTAIALSYHLLADTREETKQLLRDLVVIIDPIQNPDGRDRFLKMVAEHRGNVPNTDDQSLLHTGYFPQGRTNHYNFDLNRDWVYATQPETRGRILVLREWTPLLFTDGHELETQDTYLFSPPREPINTNIPEPTRKKWGDIFGKDQAEAFDKFGWRYYTGEWADNWYPGYSDAYASYRGAIGILDEQARIQEDGVRHANDQVETYREAIHHNIVSAVANLTTLQKNLRDIYKDYLAGRRLAMDEKGRYGKRAFAVMPTPNRARLNHFLDTLKLHGVEALETTADFTSAATDQLGRAIEKQTFPKGTILIPNRQPEAHLLAAMLEFDPRFSEQTLTDERRELLRFHRSKMYDVTAWNLTMQFGLEAFELQAGLPAGAKIQMDDKRGVTAEKIRDVGGEPVGNASNSNAAIHGSLGKVPENEGGGAALQGFAIPGGSDDALAIAAHLLEQGYKLRVTSRDTKLGETSLPRGSIIIQRQENQNTPGRFEGSRLEVLTRLQREIATATKSNLPNLVPLTTGLAPGDLPDIGGEYFPLLERPRIAVLARGSADLYDFGSIWWALDHQLGMQASYLAEDEVVPSADLRRYNVIVIPNRFAGDLPEPIIAALKPWIESGGTLIAMGSSAAALAAEKPGLSKVRKLDDVIGKTDDYALTILREWAGRTTTADLEATWATKPSMELKFPWTGALAPEDKPSEDELKRRDKWLSIFMPSGAILAARADDKHWLTLGVNDNLGWLPVTVGNGPVLMAGEGVEAPIRLGVFTPAPKSEANAPASKSAPNSPASKSEANSKEASNTKSTSASAPSPSGRGQGEGSRSSPASSSASSSSSSSDSKDDKKEEKKDDKPKANLIGWSPVPEGQEMTLRMSGLLWPEAAHRLASAPYVTRESLGRGQVILFSESPTLRGASPATTRLFLNAVILGPGLGASHPIKP
ncbi:MAG TPA: M14 family metallopeptidase [Phycisphaerales bacterium]|nr:M14 family metallopeptidase [Phycisphaerales bacterium]